MAAYCGITYLDTDAYPAEYADKLVMGNIHGNCLNVDHLTRNGSTYKGFGEEDFLSGNDVWFMPVVQKIGPDGCLYVLDWYDRYHCYQDANADPEGIDRGHGRLYRVVHEATGRPEPSIQAEHSAAQLVEDLSSGNVYVRETAQRLLGERKCDGVEETLEQIVQDRDLNMKTRLPALWSLASGHKLRPEFLMNLLDAEESYVRAWAVRLTGNQFANHADLVAKAVGLAEDSARDVQLQVAIALGKFDKVDPLPVWVKILASSGDDPLLPHIVWQNLHPHLPERSAELLGLVESVDLASSPGLAAMLPKVAEKLED